ncbi:hypothetical protein PC129_g18110 [Phytophthora cactorum]|uniref:DDE Tnp4 domain-containing protein n=2 Tax=Phytophthora cactorum TaxID=29920 RepID=A0A8T1HEF9_9STRA|nr:hypothetical protein C6341_g20503 [Phytophthora cactorum]KAG3210905.1 hypothetical protein PC129_g18110 [Phytophthora cactorum]
MRAKKTNWFHKKLRCDKASFLRIFKEVEASTNRLPASNGSKCDGVSWPRAVVYINDTLEMLVKMAKRNVVMPRLEELHAVEEGFEAIAGFPGVVGALDGTLFKIPRPRDFEGWYCRKGFPAVNVQAIVDHREAFLALSIRAGSNNDQSLWNGSGVRKRLATYIPLDKHLLGDAGYKLWGHLLTPFPENEAAEDQRKRTLTIDIHARESR